MYIYTFIRVYRCIYIHVYIRIYRRSGKLEWVLERGFASRTKRWLAEVHTKFVSLLAGTTLIPDCIENPFWIWGREEEDGEVCTCPSASPCHCYTQVSELRRSESIASSVRLRKDVCHTNTSVCDEYIYAPSDTRKRNLISIYLSNVEFLPYKMVFS